MVSTFKSTNFTFYTLYFILTNNYSSKQKHIKQLKIPHHMLHSYRFQRRGFIFRKSKMRRLANNH